MAKRVVTVVGAGNMRCAPAVASGLAVWCPDELADIRLYDTNEERLDLADRLVRECLEREDVGFPVVSGSGLDEAMDGATDVVFTVYEDCARRFFGLQEARLYDPVDPLSPSDQVRGDPNKPTSPENLSERMRQILSSPLEAHSSRDEVVKAMVDQVLPLVPNDARILSLLRGVLLPAERPHLHLNWPNPLEPDQIVLVPHQILRWIHGDAGLDDLIDTSRRSPLVDWLRQADR
ncbi:MAG: hypothetical protein JST30_05170 [Armatimonadetes bacterium]|nr:hypothetical protein [Armatimonadota bacterium]